MAIIGKIRKNFWFVLILVGLALSAFILMDMTSAGNRGGGPGSLTMGEINGNKIDYADFQRTESAYYRSNTSDVFSKRKAIWDFYVEDNLIQNEAENLGLMVSEEEMTELQFGQNMSPIVRQNWTNPQTGQVDRAQLNTFKTALENGDDLNPDFKAYWDEQEKQITKNRLQTKLNNIVAKGIYMPKWMAQESYKEDNTKTDFSYVKIPFDKMTNQVEVTDADITAYLNENKDRFTNEEETRVLEYLVYDVVPSKEDSTAQFEKATQLAADFKASKTDSMFAVNNGGGFANFFFNESQLPAVAKDAIKNLEVGDVYGPYFDNNTYSMVKMVDKRVVPDTVEARHILRNADRTNKTALAAAQSYVDSLITELKRGASFEDMAKEHSQDQGSAANGGSLGEFGQGRMVPEFNEVCFITGKPGNYYSVVSQFGVHLIELQNQTFRTRDPKYKIASIATTIVPSEDTQNAYYDLAADLVSEHRNMTSLQTAIEGGDVSFQSSNGVSINDYTVGTLGTGQSSRDMIKWAFDESTELGDVAPDIYSYDDPVNYYTNKYVVTTLKSIEPAGLQSASAARSTVETAVANQMKAKALASSLNVSTLADVASKYEVEVQEATDVSLKSGFIPGVGNEPDVIASAFALPVQSVSKPIVGTSGLFLVSPRSKTEAGEASNLPFVMKNANDATRSAINVKLIESLKKGANISDDRATFF